jgi:hypothetical protein
MLMERNTNRGSFVAVLGIISFLFIFLAGIPLIPGVHAQVVTPEIIPSETPDRLQMLAEPTLPANPIQADLGSQAYWLHCMPCHGQHGEGLTEDFRNLYPPEDRNCWDSGCHGSRPYEGGFTLPKAVPSLIGPGALQKFETASNLFAFINAAMPFQDPGSLDVETYWQITAFVLRENGVVQDPGLLGPENAVAVRLQPEATPGPQLILTPVAGVNVEPIRSTDPAVDLADSSSLPVIVGIGLLLLGVGGAVWRARRARG